MQSECDVAHHHFDHRFALPRGGWAFAHARRDDWNQVHRGGAQARTRNAKVASSILASPLEHHVGVDAVLGGKFRYGHVRRTGQCRQLLFEIDRIIRAAFTARPRNAVCCQDGSRHSNDGRHFDSRYLPWEDGLGETLTTGAPPSALRNCQKSVSWGTRATTICGNCPLSICRWHSGVFRSAVKYGIAPREFPR